MIRALMIVTGLGLAVLVILAVKADPRLWGEILAHLDQQARMHANQIDGHLSRLVTPSPSPGRTHP